MVFCGGDLSSTRGTQSFILGKVHKTSIIIKEAVLYVLCDESLSDIVFILWL